MSTRLNLQQNNAVPKELKVKFDDSSEEFIISFLFLASYLLLSTQVDSSDGFYHSQPVSSMDNVSW